MASQEEGDRVCEMVRDLLVHLANPNQAAAILEPEPTGCRVDPLYEKYVTRRAS